MQLSTHSYKVHSYLGMHVFSHILFPMHLMFFFFFASYIDKGSSLSRGNISPRICKSSKKFLSDHPKRAFKLYNLIMANNFVNFLQPGYNGFSASFNNLENNSGSF